MNRFLAICALAALAACSGGGNPLNNGGPGGGGGEDTDEIDPELRQNLNQAAYNAGDETLTIQLDSLDASPFNATLTRNAALDVGEYEAYEVQEATQQRQFIALFRTNARENATVGTVADGGQFVNYFAGGIYSRIDVFSRPASGLAVYEGSYAGVLNTGDPTAPLDSRAPYRTEGNMRITADFGTNGSLTGGITGRRIIDTGDDLVDVFFDAAPIDETGRFEGEVLFADRSRSGIFGGLFAGENASDAAGIIVINPISSNSDLFEHGAFVIPCVDTGTGVPCP